MLKYFVTCSTGSATFLGISENKEVRMEVFRTTMHLIFDTFLGIAHAVGEFDFIFVEEVLVQLFKVMYMILHSYEHEKRFKYLNTVSFTFNQNKRHLNIC